MHKLDAHDMLAQGELPSRGRNALINASTIMAAAGPIAVLELALSINGVPFIEKGSPEEVGDDDGDDECATADVIVSVMVAVFWEVEGDSLNVLEAGECVLELEGDAVCDVSTAKVVVKVRVSFVTVGVGCDSVLIVLVVAQSELPPID